MIVLMALVSFPNTIFANSTVLDKFSSQYDEKGIGQILEKVWGAANPLINIVIFFLVAIGIILILGSILYMGWKLLGTIGGKGGVTKEVVRNFVIALLFGVLITTSGWMSILKIANTIVEKGVEVLDVNETIGSGSSSGGGTIQ